MNRLRLAAVLSLSLVPLFAADASEQVQVAVKGMTCASCAKKVRQALQSLPNATAGSAEVVLSENKAFITVAKADKETCEAISQIVKKAGFEVVGGGDGCTTLPPKKV